MVLTDVLSRFAGLRNPDREVIFTTGTDEHGLKIQQAAKAQNIGEEEFCASVSQRFKVGSSFVTKLTIGPGREGEYRVHRLYPDRRGAPLQGGRAFLGELRRGNTLLRLTVATAGRLGRYLQGNTFRMVLRF